MGGLSSAYKMNVDGIATTLANDIDLEPNDSVYVFVQVNVNPSTANLPFIIRDSIQISYNGNNRFVQLEAWGQNAHFFRGRIINSNETWVNDLPYVIQGFLYINAGQSLTIEKGCRIYMHADAPIVVDGTLRVNGQADTVNRVYFQGDRLDDPYKDYPAGWPGIYFSNSSKDNVLNYAVIRNGYQSLALEGLSSTANPKLTLNQTIIDNSYDAGIISVNSSIRAQNCLLSNCGKNIVITKGGSYQFTNCTVASYGNSYIAHKDPVLAISNAGGGGTAALTAQFRNCIFWGEGSELENEVTVTKENTSFAFDVLFDYVLWKVKNTPGNINPASGHIINNQSPQFDTINTAQHLYNFRLRPGSPAINAGVNAGISIDLDGKPRPVGQTDLGCYEKQ